MKLLVFFILSLPIFATEPNFSDREKEYIVQNPLVTIALMPDFTPFSYIAEDKIVGFENDLLALISQKAGLKFQKQFGIWNKNLQEFKNKKVDLIASISYKKERESFVNFTSPYYRIPIMIFVRDDFGRYDGIGSLEGKRVGVLKDVFYLNELENFANLELVIFETYEDVTNALVFGKIDALIQNLPNINHLIKKNLYTNLVLAGELQLPGITKEDLRFGVNPQKPILHSIIQKSLDSLSENEIRGLIDKWIDVKYNQPKNSFIFTKEEQEYIDLNTITYCIDPKFMPFEFIDSKGRHNGLSKDYLDKIVQKTGMRVEFIKTKDWSETLKFLENRTCDISLMIGKTKKREEFLRFTDVYLESPQVIAMRNDANFVASINDVLNKKIGVIKDYAIGDLLKSKYRNFELIYVNDNQDGLLKVARGELDGFINFLPTISAGINQVATGNLKIAGKIDEMVQLSAAIRGDNPILFSVIQKSFSIFETNEHKEILDKWMTVKFEYGTDYNLVWRVMGAGFFLLLLFGYWNHKIQQAKKIIEKQNKELEILAMTDKLTGVYNRSKLDEILQAQIDSSNRYNQTFGCAIIDIDYFKEVNDVHGHLIGDRVLVEIANLINRSLRKSDIFGRWGGEEFLIIAPAVNKESFLQLLSKVLEIVSSYEIEAVGKKTISIGATICLEKDTEDNLIKRADDALYRAKNSGRNQVVIYE